MSERLSGAERDTGQRFNDFIVEHAEQALRWEMVDERSGVPLKFVEFATTDEQNRWVPTDSPAVVNYAMDLWVGLSKDERKKRGMTSAGILLETQEGGVLTVLDDCCQLPSVIGCNRSDAPQDGVRTVDMLLDKMQGLMSNGLLIPAGKRTFSLDDNTINSLKSLEE